MKKVKTAIALLLAMCLLLSAVACTKSAPTVSNSPAPTSAGSSASASNSASSSAPTLSPEQQWAEDNGLNKTETVDELYEAAKKEGEVVIYSISSRMEKVLPEFEAAYPGVKLVPYDISTDELLEKITREYTAGIRTADIVHIKEQTGQILKEYIEKGIFHNYQPEDIFNTIDDKYKYVTPLYFEMSWWFYNTEVNPNGCPVNSWWDLTKPEWKGKFLFTDPMENSGYMALLTTMVQNDDLMAEDYKKVFGKDIELAPDEPNAGYAFIKRFAQNNPIYESSSGGIVKNVGTPGQTTAPVGYAASSKLREREDQGYVIDSDPVNFSPAIGIYGLNTLSIVNEAPHPNAAKLLIRFLMGEADGKGKGFEPFNTLGGWSARSNVPLAEGNIPFNDIPLFETDLEFVYENIQDVRDYWLSVQP